MAPPLSKKKTGTITIRDADEQRENNQGSYYGEQADCSPQPNEDTIAKMAEFVTQNPGIFEQLGRFFKGKGKQRAESLRHQPELSERAGSSRQQPHHSPPEPSERRSVPRQSKSEPSKRQSSRVGDLSGVLAGTVCKKNDAYSPKKKTPHPTASNRASPFVPEINEDPTPIHFKLPTIPFDDEKGNPENHVHAFMFAFQLYRASDAVMCRAFPTSLSGNALRWFWKLPPSSINDLGELTDEFVKRFVSSKPISKKAASLMNIRQKSQESLREYVYRFTTESLQVPDPNEEVAVAAFVNGLLPGRLTTQFHEEYSETLEELWTRVGRGI